MRGLPRSGGRKGRRPDEITRRNGNRTGWRTHPRATHVELHHPGAATTIPANEGPVEHVGTPDCDAHSEDVEAGLRAAGLSGPDGSFHVDVLLVPHLGSHRNVNTAFFRRVTVDQYLFTSNGKFGNPRDQTLQMILDARRGDAGRRDKYVLQFLNRDGTAELGTRLDMFFASRSSDEFGYRRIFRSTSESAILIDLMERVRY